MEIYIKRTEDTLDITVTGHTATEYCNAVSCLMWSILAYAENRDNAEHDYTHDFRSGNSHIVIKNCSQDIMDFMETAFAQLSYNNSEIQIKSL